MYIFRYCDIIGISSKDIKNSGKAKVITDEKSFQLFYTKIIEQLKVTCHFGFWNSNVNITKILSLYFGPVSYLQHILVFLHPSLRAVNAKNSCICAIIKMHFIFISSSAFVFSRAAAWLKIFVHCYCI